MTKYPGIKLTLGGEDYILPPISLGALEQLKDGIAAFNGDITDGAQVSTVIDAALASLNRNYPDITRAQVADMIDVGNMADVFSAVMDVSGLKRKALEESASGEAAAGTT
jgi:hypothetical protein